VGQIETWARSVRGSLGQSQVFVTILARTRSIALSVLFGAGVPAWADDVSVPTCAPIAPHIVEIRPSDLSRLSENQRTNVQNYLAEQSHLQLPIPKRLYLMKGPEPASGRETHFSLIFKGRGCSKDRCLGTAIIRKALGTTTHHFSYRNNFVAVPYTASAIPGAEYGQSTSLVFMDSEERSLLAFYDMFGLPKEGPKQSVNSVAAVFADEQALARQETYALYRACLQNAFEASGPIGPRQAR
jgi:hypothetical protein